MISDWARKTFRGVLEAIARVFQRMGLTPNHLTIIGLVLQGIVGAVLALGYLPLGGVLLILFSAFDAVDGTLARLTGSSTKFGSFLDSTIDRYAEGLTLGGLAIYFTWNPGQVEVILVFATLVGSFLVSYTRAKAESLDLDCKVGILTRAERVLLLAIGLIFYQWQPFAALPPFLTWVLLVMAILSNVTAVQRILYVRKITAPTETEPASAEALPGGPEG